MAWYVGVRPEPRSRDFLSRTGATMPDQAIGSPEAAGPPSRSRPNDEFTSLDYRNRFGIHTMFCQDLAARIERFQPEAVPRDVARLCLLLANHVDDLHDLDDDDRLARAWQEMGIRLQAATDQHAAMTEELEQIAGASPESFTLEQIWVLIRAIKVQSQVLQLYVGQPQVEA